MGKITAVFECSSIENYGILKKVKMKVFRSRENEDFVNEDSINVNTEGSLKIWVEKDSKADNLFLEGRKYTISFEQQNKISTNVQFRTKV